MYDDFHDRSAFYVVYIAEAHTVDGWQTESNEEQGIRVKQPSAFEERLDAARICAKALGLTIPILVDGMDNNAFEAFAAWPERIYIVNPEGRIHYRGGPGPYDFKPEEARSNLIELMERASDDTGEEWQT